jgi:hypothetical protein
MPTSLTISDSVILHNQAVGGAGGAGQGGGFYESTNGLAQPSNLTIDHCAVLANAAAGGAGTSGGAGGNGQGGGLFIDAGATATVLHSILVRNRAEGGAAGAEGSDGQGVGGGVYNLGTFDLDAASIVIGNDASTSDDNVFGPITPL